jgi:hypothetical protein
MPAACGADSSISAPPPIPGAPIGGPAIGPATGAVGAGVGAALSQPAIPSPNANAPTRLSDVAAIRFEKGIDKFLLENRGDKLPACRK